MVNCPERGHTDRQPRPGEWGYAGYVAGSHADDCAVGALDRFIGKIWRGG